MTDFLAIVDTVTKAPEWKLLVYFLSQSNIVNKPTTLKTRLTNLVCSQEYTKRLSEYPSHDEAVTTKSGERSNNVSVRNENKELTI